MLLRQTLLKKLIILHMELTTPYYRYTGAFTTKEALSRHLTSKEHISIIDRSGKGVPNIVHGVNQNI
jgi:hypothetical protein